MEAIHHGHIVVTDVDGTVVAAHGDPDVWVYPRSTLKPFQAAAVVGLVGGDALTSAQLAIICASHAGSERQQGLVSGLLAAAGLDQSALRCPPALPLEHEALLAQRAPLRLAHNCSGKHAGFLVATKLRGGDIRRYLDPDSPVQQAVVQQLAANGGVAPQGPGVDGCGAPAWRLPMRAVARAFASLSAGNDRYLPEVRAAMTAHPELVGSSAALDSVLMGADRRVVAKRGAEAMIGIGVQTSRGPLGIALKGTDGHARATGPAAAAVLTRLGIGVPDGVARPAVLGGGFPHGRIEVAGELSRTLACLTM